MNSVKFSIIFSVFNDENYLEKFFNSLFNQNFKDFEVISIYHESQDNSLKILNEYAEKHNIKTLFYTQDNVNKFEKSDILGEYLVFTSPENIFEPDSLELLSKDISSKSNELFFSKFSFSNLNNFKVVKNVNINLQSSITFNNYYDIENSNLFNQEYYESNHVYDKKCDAFLHYMCEGYKNGWKPSVQFDTEYYLNKYPEAILAPMDPLSYYFLIGNEKGFDELNSNVTRRKNFKRIISLIENEEFDKLTISIKTPNPISGTNWGDHFFASSLKDAFVKKGFKVLVHPHERFYEDVDKTDIVIVLRGLERYNTNPNHINLMWNISHPEDISIDEYEDYDIVFVASEKYAKKIDELTDTIVKPLLQCTDSKLFYPNENSCYAEDILFVGNTRGVFRNIVQDISKTSYDFSVYGTGNWTNFIDSSHFKGEFIPNNYLNQYYSSAKILLNDHWEDMRLNEFPSNRLFDAFASEAFIISDDIPIAKTLFKNNLVTYKDVDDLIKKIDYYLNHDKKRMLKAKRGREIVLKQHTFNKRVNTILLCLKNLI